MQHKMIPLFSVPLFKTNIGPLDAIERTWIDSLEYPPKAVARDKSDEHLPMVNRGMHILNSGQLKNTKIKIQNALEYFTKAVMGIEQNFRITTSWINKIPKEDWIQQHSHANSVISGVYYIDVPDDNMGDIVFDDRKVTPKTNTLLLFPNNIFHAVEPNQSDKSRISIAFNYGDKI